MGVHSGHRPSRRGIAQSAHTPVGCGQGAAAAVQRIGAACHASTVFYRRKAACTAKKYAESSSLEPAMRSTAAIPCNPSLCPLFPLACTFAGTKTHTHTQHNVHTYTHAYTHKTNTYRYEKRHTNIAAHVSPCFRVRDGDTVVIGQCR